MAGIESIMLIDCIAEEGLEKNHSVLAKNLVFQVVIAVIVYR